MTAARQTGADIRSLADALIARAAANGGQLTSAELATSVESADVNAAQAKKLLRSLADAGVTVLGLDAQTDRSLASWALTGPTLLVIGSEQAGMTPAVRRACTGLARLVAPGPIESLNASVAAAIALYEATRQRTISTT